MAQDFGGGWTERKLQAVREYMWSYATILKSTPFKFAYIDAFAGSGQRMLRKPVQPSLFQNEEAREFAIGSARIALSSDPSFDSYIFIEKNPQNVQQLEALRAEYLHLPYVQIKQGDANAELTALARKNWRQHRALVFLDPYGMAVDWTTVAALASTKAVDLWYLFPLGIGLNRMVKRDGRIPKNWADKISRLLGTERAEWEPAFYRERKVQTLFDETETEREKVSIESIKDYVVERLKSVFPGVEEPLALRNRTGCPIFLLCFAAANPKGAPTACKIARSIINKLRKAEEP